MSINISLLITIIVLTCTFAEFYYISAMKMCIKVSPTLSYMCYFAVFYPAKIINLNFYPLEVVSRYRDRQLQVGENYSYLFNFRSILCKS